MVKGTGPNPNKGHRVTRNLCLPILIGVSRGTPQSIQEFPNLTPLVDRPGTCHFSPVCLKFKSASDRNAPCSASPFSWVGPSCPQNGFGFRFGVPLKHKGPTNKAPGSVAGAVQDLACQGSRLPMELLLPASVDTETEEDGGHLGPPEFYPSLGEVPLPK